MARGMGTSAPNGGHALGHGDTRIYMDGDTRRDMSASTYVPGGLALARALAELDVDNSVDKAVGKFLDLSTISTDLSTSALSPSLLLF